MMRSLVPVLALTACGGDRPPDPCDKAVSGDACVYAGTGQQGINREHPRLDRLESLLDTPTGITFGPDGRAYIVDYNNHQLRRVEKDQTVVRVLGADYEGDGSPEMQDRLPACDPAGAPGDTVAMNHPTHAVFGPDGLLYVAAWHNNKIRTLDPKTGIAKTIAGDFYGFSGDGGAACAATFNQPSAIAIADDGTIYTSDQRNVRVRMLTPDRTVSTIAGDGHKGNIGDGGPAIAAEFGWDTSNTPPVSGAVALDPKRPGLLYIADSANNRIRRLHLDTGLIDCIAGNSSAAGYSGDGGDAINATMSWPLGLAVGPDDRLYVADEHNHAVRAIDLTSGVITTVVGDGQVCNTTVSKCPDLAPATQMELQNPFGVAFDPEGNLYVADTYNNRILKVVR